MRPEQDMEPRDGTERGVGALRTAPSLEGCGILLDEHGHVGPMQGSPPPLVLSLPVRRGLMAQDWRDDSDSRLTRALVEMEERVEELERRCSMLEDEAGVRLFEDMGMDYEDEPVNGDLEEYLEDRDDDPDDPDFDDPDFLGDFDDDEDEVLEVADSCDSAVLESTHDSQELGGSK